MLRLSKTPGCNVSLWLFRNDSQMILYLKVQQMSKYDPKVFKNYVFDYTRPLWDLLVWWKDSTTLRMTKQKIFKRERMKNQPISKKKKSIFVKFSFAMRWKYHHLKLKPSMALHRLTPQSTIAFCMIYEWTMSSLFPPHAKMCQTNQLGKRLKNIFPSCVVAF